MVLYRVVSPKVTSNLPSLEQFGNVDPSVPVTLVGLEQESLFLLSPRLFVDLRVQLIMPSEIIIVVPLSALLTRSTCNIVFLLHQCAY